MEHVSLFLARRPLSACTNRRAHAAMTELLLERRVARFRPLHQAESAALRALGNRAHTAPRGKILLGPDCLPNQTVLMHAGWAILYRDLADGRRQIMQFCLPGDLVDPCNLLMERRDFSIAAVTEVSYSIIGFAELTATIERHPGLALGLLWSEAREIYLLRSHLLSVGRLTAKERLAALFLELWERLTAIGQAGGDHFQMHVNQEMLADATGLSTVHVNRTLNAMQAEGLIERHGHGFLIINYQQLRWLVPDMLIPG
jgi:CRP-like cAMP-binding protein